MALPGRGTYRLPDIPGLTIMLFSHCDDFPRIIPTTDKYDMTPIVGSYTPASAPAFDIW